MQRSLNVNLFALVAACAVVVAVSASWIANLRLGSPSRRGSKVVLATVAPSAVLFVLDCGPMACFVPGNSKRLLGWFVVGGLSLPLLSIILFSF